MAGLADKYEPNDVAIMEVVRFGSSATVLTDYCQGYDYLAVRTDPVDTVMDDYEKTEILSTCCTYTMIDLTTMKVLTSNCGTTTEDAETCITDHL